MSRFRIIGQLIEFDHEPIGVIAIPSRGSLFDRVVEALDGLPEDWRSEIGALREECDTHRIVD